MTELPQPLALTLELALVAALLPAAIAVAAAVNELRRRPLSLRRRVCLIASAGVTLVAAAAIVRTASAGIRIDSPTAALAIARAAHDQRWPSTTALAAAVERMRADAELRDLGELIALTVAQTPRDATPELFASGARVRHDRPPVAAFEGWSLHRLAADRCLVIVYFRPAAPLSDRHLWLHEYPEARADYIDAPAAMPPADWQPGELSWQVFTVGHARRFAMYAGIEQDGALGPAALLGAVDDCRPIR